MLSIPTGMVLLPSPSAESKDRKPPCCREISTSPSDAASAERGVPGSTGWKRDGNAPRIQLQPLSLLFRLSPAQFPRKDLVALPRETVCPLVLLCWPRLPLQTGGACRTSAGLKDVTAEGTLCNPASHAITAPTSQKDTWGIPKACMPLCWVLPHGGRNCPQEVQWEKGDGEVVPPCIDASAILSTTTHSAVLAALGRFPQGTGTPTARALCPAELPPRAVKPSRAQPCSSPHP